IRHFTKVLVSPEVPGLWNLCTGNFQPLIDAGAFCKSVNPPTLPVLHLENSRIAVAGNRASHQYDIVTPDNYYPLFSYYTDEGRQRWVTALDSKYPYVASTAQSVAASLDIAFVPAKPELRYDVAQAKEMTIDGDLPEWSYEGDLNLHKWARAQPLQFNFGKDWGIFYALASSNQLYLALTAPDSTVPVGDGKIEIAFGKNRLSIARAAGGEVKVELEGKKLADVEAKWQALAKAPDDAGAAGATMLPGFGLELARPRNSHALQSAMEASLSRNANGVQARYPVDGDFVITMDGVRVVGEARVDISSKDQALEVVDVSAGTVFGIPSWNRKKKDANHNLTASFPVDSTSWTPTTLTFRAKADTTITIKFRGPHKTVNGKTEKIWVGYDSVSLDGASLANGDFSKTSGGMPAGWQFWKDTDSGDQAVYITEGGAGDGGPWIKLWHNCPAVQNIKVKGGKTLVLKLSARAIAE
ncbi:MAG: hypothetical protein JXR97_10565, partial [Planctomycetes bacterium]|nr:hypothetical protein [Planctomycetota bacterium]